MVPSLHPSDVKGEPGLSLSGQGLEGSLKATPSHRPMRKAANRDPGIPLGSCPWLGNQPLTLRGAEWGGVLLGGASAAGDRWGPVLPQAGRLSGELCKSPCS